MNKNQDVRVPLRNISLNLNPEPIKKYKCEIFKTGFLNMLCFIYYSNILFYMTAGVYNLINPPKTVYTSLELFLYVTILLSFMLGFSMFKVVFKKEIKHYKMVLISNFILLTMSLIFLTGFIFENYKDTVVIYDLVFIQIVSLGSLLLLSILFFLIHRPVCKRYPDAINCYQNFDNKTRGTPRISRHIDL